MIKQWYILILLLVSIFKIEANNYNAIQYANYFKQLKALEYNDAVTSSQQFNDTPLQHALENLAKLLYCGGQQLQKDDFYPREKLTGNEDVLYQSVIYLTRGYCELYFEVDKSNGFSNFNKAYGLAKETELDLLISCCLRAILKLYHWELLQSNHQYQTYLKALEELAKDDVDRFWVNLYKTILHSKTIFNIDELDTTSLMQPLDALVHQRKITQPGLLALYFYEKAMSLEFSSKNEEAIKSYEKVLLYTEGLPFLKYVCFGTHVHLSIIQSRFKNYDVALHQLDLAKKYIDKSDTLRSQYHLLSYSARYYEGLQHFDSAYQSLKNSVALGHQIEYNENSQKISELKILYDTEKQEKENLILKSELAYEQRQRNIILALIGVLVVMAILIVKNAKKKQQLKAKTLLLEKQRMVTLLKEQELANIDAMISGQEKERQLIANDLHDDLGGLMATLKLHFGNLKKSVSETTLQHTEDLLDEAYSKIRTIAHVRNSGVMAKQGLLKAVQQMAQKISAANSLELEVLDYGLEQRLENSLELTLFRIIQELVSNTIKHADASKGSIQLTQHHDFLNIIVEDNGIGFDTTNLQAFDGMGILNIAKRVEHLEGTFTVDSIIGKGTSVLIDIPI